MKFEYIKENFPKTFLILNEYFMSRFPMKKIIEVTSQNVIDCFKNKVYKNDWELTNIKEETTPFDNINDSLIYSFISRLEKVL